ncbi:MAG: YbhB/YbcL family Raf kinase inhibitor-like protein [Rhodobacter sp.]|nr:YbhB/YbcL family Raf kinase inhibitor-like protein [Rhodobacter sp.]
MKLTSPDFAHGSRIPPEFTCDGANLSPAFAWTGVPVSAMSLLLACYDPDAPGGTFHHWAVYGIPARRTGLPAGFGPDSPEIELHLAVNDFGRSGYGGPCPPRGHGLHHYHFRLSALSGDIDASPAARCGEIRRKAGPLEIAVAELIGLYERP